MCKWLRHLYRYISIADTSQLGDVWVLGPRRHRWFNQSLYRTPGRKTTWLWPVPIGVKQCASMDSKALASPCNIWPALSGSGRMVYHPTKVGEYALGVVLDHERRVYVPWLRPICRQPLVRYPLPLICTCETNRIAGILHTSYSFLDISVTVPVYWPSHSFLWLGSSLLAMTHYCGSQAGRSQPTIDSIAGSLACAWFTLSYILRAIRFTPGRLVRDYTRPVGLKSTSTVELS